MEFRTGNLRRDPCTTPSRRVRKLGADVEGVLRVSSRLSRSAALYSASLTMGREGGGGTVDN